MVQHGPRSGKLSAPLSSVGIKICFHDHYKDRILCNLLVPKFLGNAETRFIKVLIIYHVAKITISGGSPIGI